MGVKRMDLRRMRRASIAVLVSVLAAAAAAGCGAAGSDPAPTQAKAPPTKPAAKGQAAAVTRRWTTGYPNSIAVLGHSGATGESSDPAQPGVEVRENSWATGTNPEVNSLYLRILSQNPAIKGNNTNLAQGSARVEELASQADELLQTAPKPELIVIQIMDNDMVCPAAATTLSAFRLKLTSTLRKLAKGAPDSALFVVSQFGSPTDELKTLTATDRATMGGTGPCDYINQAGKSIPRKVLRLEKAVHDYEAQLNGACQRVRQCTYDGGAFGRAINRRDYGVADFHFSVKGHAKASAVAWSALTRAGVVPR